ncbi:MAG: hypothetical protein ACU85V_15420 [Gammaproteobacteria bacterium]
MYVIIDPSLAASTTPLYTPGQIGMDHDGKIYKYLQYVEGTAAVDGVAGEVAYYYEDSGPIDFKVTSDLSDCTGDIGAGVLQVAMSDLEYAWLQIKGPATLSIALTAGADGDSLTPTGAGDGTLDLAVAAETDHICATAVDASAAIILCDFPF